MTKCIGKLTVEVGIKGMDEVKDLIDEVDFLRYFYSKVDNALGPASDDVYCIIKDRYQEETGKKLPEGYGDDEDEDDYYEYDG